MAEHDSDSGRRGLTRRELIRRAAIVGGAAVWSAPVVRMAAGANGGRRTVHTDGARLVTYDGPCSPVLLTAPITTRTVCATTLAAAETSFGSTVTAECEERCRLLGPCHADSRADKCKIEKLDGTTVGAVTCTGPGPDCPGSPYATGTREFVCTAVVTCRCVCR